MIGQMADGTAQALARLGVERDRLAVLQDVSRQLPAGTGKADCAARFEAEFEDYEYPTLHAG